MSTVTAATSAAGSVDNGRLFWERLWRQSGISFVALLLVGYFVRGQQPGVGATSDALAGFYDGHHLRILIASVITGLSILNLMWFAAALRTILAEAGEDGWGAAATASSAAVGGLFLLILAIGAALASSIARSGNSALTSGLNDMVWSCIVLSSFPGAMLIMSGTFGLWRAGIISTRSFAWGVTAVVLGVLGGTTWMRSGFWAPDGIYSQFVWPIIGLVWILAVSRVMTRTPATRTGW